MRYADEHTQRKFEEAQRAGGRPANSPGWGTLTAVRSDVFASQQGERVTVTAGVTGVAPCHWLAREYPEAFRVCDKRDARTTRDHARSLAHVRAELERGMPARPARSKGVLAPKGVLPPKPAWRLRRQPACTRVLP